MGPGFTFLRILLYKTIYDKEELSLFQTHWDYPQCLLSGKGNWLWIENSKNNGLGPSMPLVSSCDSIFHWLIKHNQRPIKTKQFWVGDNVTPESFYATYYAIKEFVKDST